MATLSAQDFELELTVIGGWDAYIAVSGKSYSGAISFEVLDYEYDEFKKTIAKLYKTLKEGEAVLKEDYGNSNYIKFTSDGLGHFIISGELYDCNMFWKLSFSETVDQTYFRNFISELSNEK